MMTEKIWFGWMSHTGVWGNPDHTIKGYEHLGPVEIDAVDDDDDALSPEQISQIAYIQRVLDTEPVAYWPGGDVLFVKGSDDDGH